MSTDFPKRIRLSQRRFRSNPILESDRVFKQGMGRRDQERRQLERLLELQRADVPIYCMPNFIRVDGSGLTLSQKRIGVVGLVVDNVDVGLVTQIQVIASPSWEISVELPFRHAHVQSMLLRLVGEAGVDEGLPELLAFKIGDSLGERCEGDSMDIACLLAIVDAVNGCEHELFRAVAAVISPADGSDIEPSKSIDIKLQAFVREFGRGSLLVRHANDTQAALFDDWFDTVWPVNNLRDLAEQLANAGLIEALNRQVSLTSEHGLAISTRTQHLLSSETTFQQASDFLRRVRGRIIAETPLRIKLDVSYAEEDLHRHCGNFDQAIEVRSQRAELEQNPLISCCERMADSDNRHAAALYDAHRFSEAIDCLEPWVKKFGDDPKICLPETRSFVFNTLGRCLVIVGDSRWEQMFQHSLEIQRAVSPANIARTHNILIHGLFKCRRYQDAAPYLDGTPSIADDYRVWLRAELARQNGATWDENDCESIFKINQTHHVFGFAIQAAARQVGRTMQSRAKHFRHARDCFLHHVEKDSTNWKRLLSVCCELALAVATQDDNAFDVAMIAFENLSKMPSMKAVRAWYTVPLAKLQSQRDWTSIENLFCHIPHL